MTTFTDTRKLGSVQDFTAEIVRDLVGDYLVRGKTVDTATEDPMKMFNRIDWVLNRVGRALDVTGKLDTDKTSFKIDRDADNVLHVRFTDLKGKTLYVLDFGDKNTAKGKGEFEYVLRNADGKVEVRNHKWSAISAFFAPEKEAPVAKAAAPKKTKKAPAKKAAPAKKEKAVKAVKNPVPATPADADVMNEVDKVLGEELPADL